MGFQELSERVSTRAEEHPVTIRLIKRKAKTCAYLSIRMAMMEELKWSAEEKVALALGDGDDAGKMRLIRKGKKGKGFPLRMLKKRGLLDLGYVAAFGLDPTAKIGLDAAIIDGDIIEMTIPNFAEHPDLGEDDDDDAPPPKLDADLRRPNEPADAKSLHIPLRSAATAPTPAAARQETAGVTAVEHSGVRVTGGAKPMITCHGERLDLTPRQARFMAMLVKVLGSMLPTAALIQKIGLTASAGASQISDDYFALKEPLADLGLRLTFTPKMGYTLAKA